ncbi:helix-turn-helix domain-containing protein [Actinomadura rugatobispora]|uniref:Helix-turn-helix domain-containing protein n=1 Tax=Actinomadura rugatobispora TaxID=1994 RepID=A0ABW1A4F2_9ACTN|nr:helix-turn-helix transcriptional regulator [Actinomadura rugatobispora]
MPSPYVRRRRLAAELRKLRENRGLTTDELAKLVYQSRTKITRLELGQIRPDLAEVMKILETLGVEGPRYDRLVRLAREAAEKGWWDRYGNPMGPRQRLAADLESSAAKIRCYDQTNMPAIFQLPDFISSIVELDAAHGELDYRPDRMADARLQRQRRIFQKDGPTYETILDECVIHRLAVPTKVMTAQLRHLVAVVSAESRVTVRVLPANVTIPGGLLPKSSFFLYTFTDHADPPLVVVDTVTTDLVHTQRREVAQYTVLYNRLRKAALSPADSLTFLTGVADRQAKQAGSEL